MESTRETNGQSLLMQRIADLDLRIEGSRVERLREELYRELAARSVAFRPPLYLTYEWGCPDRTPLIGVPFYLADARLEDIEAEASGAIEDDAEAMRYLRHECGHAVNYAFRLYDDPEWQRLFGLFTSAYRERYAADPLSRAHVRHILGWYAQKHPDEDFAETFAVWLTPGLDWRSEYAGWPALAKLEYVERVMRAHAGETVAVPEIHDDDRPVWAIEETVEELYRDQAHPLPIDDPRLIDVGDLRRIFLAADDAPAAEPAHAFLRRHYRGIVARIAYWTSAPPPSAAPPRAARPAAGARSPGAQPPGVGGPPRVGAERAAEPRALAARPAH